MLPAVQFTNVTKHFPAWNHLGSGIKSLLLRPSQINFLLTERRLTALQNVSFAISPGETVALTGHNGAGKSTLLGLLAGVLIPSSGTVVARGRIGAMLELGAGFHPELSGRENIRLNATLMGLRQRDINRVLSAIVEFAELGHFIDEPVRIYSSGMLARLGFAVMTQISPDILLLDEVLAVGDISFRQKCQGIIEQFKQRGVTIIMVSHNHADIEAFCDRVLWFEQGSLIESGAPSVILPRYAQRFSQS
ncbi:ABC transporter ATP-binding protein [Enterobacter mori]|uniref:ABC transporter ATP-binding protein n=1 Tax=Enterobacter TaxID=547 RepID=UPI0007B3C6F9|nr:sugar ABC transporter ATP-binding protein [Enterobacter genomosp. O]MBS0865799.1 ABC transporter ATP-binding protein [Enterobacter mori]